ncbi:MAG TPA: hypothetical protein VFD73_15270, partial [Gemmatimonadales bacterium]|nr:hypothetical protein [Gemmatimonadales bacterium]
MKVFNDLELDRGQLHLLQHATPENIRRAQGAAERRIRPFLKYIREAVYYRTIDGWYCQVRVMDIRWSFGRVDFLVEQGDKIAWVSHKLCFLPPGSKRLRNTGSVDVVRKPEGQDEDSQAEGPDSPGGAGFGPAFADGRGQYAATEGARDPATGRLLP